MNQTAAFIENDFRCSACGKRVPAIVLAIKKKTALCNQCDETLFYDTYCKKNISEEEKGLRLLEVTESQLKLLIQEVRNKGQSNLLKWM